MKTIVNFVLDETGSMGVCRTATISGFNEYIQNLKTATGKVLFTLTKFNSTKVEVVYNAVPLDQVVPLTEETYVPNMLTPLYDAIAKTIHATEAKIKSFSKKAPAVLCVIMTDGMENASVESTREDIFKLIKDKEAEGWTFVFLGANIDSYAVGEAIGVPKGNTSNYNQAKTRNAMASVGGMSAGYVSRGSAQTSHFFTENREDAGDETWQVPEK